MGLFSRKEKIPDPQISIHLDPALANNTFRPGSTVCGTISIASPIPRQLVSAQIRLFGLVMTHNTKKETRQVGAGKHSSTTTVYIKYHDEVQLFNIGQEISSGSAPIGLEKQLKSPFSLIFPAGTGAVDGAGPYVGKTAQSGLYAVEAHELPPSFSYSEGRLDYATVEYRLQVIAYFEERPEPFIHNSVQPLVFSPLQAPHQPGLQEFIRPPQIYNSSRLLGEEKSIGHSIRDKFSANTPSVSVVVKASVPVCVPAASGFTIHTCVEIDRLSHPTIKIPTAAISIKSVTLLPITAWRALKVDRPGRSTEREVVREETVRLNAVPGSVAVKQQKIGPEDKLVFSASFEARVPGSVCPTFRTLNINRSYMLKLTLEAEISGKVFKYKVENRVGVLSNLTS